MLLVAFTARIFRMNRIIIVSGPPAAGKTTLANALARRFERAVCIPVDDMREWVVSGRSDPIPDWNDETSRQFQLAEDAAADLALRYSEAGFDVVLDHCRLPENIEAWVARCFTSCWPLLIAVVPPLEVTINRNSVRDNKEFETSVLEPAICGITAAYQAADLSSWIVTENLLEVEAEVDGLMRHV